MERYLVNAFGAIRLSNLVNRIGRESDNGIRLRSNLCSRRHASIINRADNTWVIVNHSAHCAIFINDTKLEPGNSINLTIGDIISFSGVVTFRFSGPEAGATIEIPDDITLTPD